MSLALKKPEPATLSGFAELAAALYWAPGEMVAVIRAYFDESGLHRSDGSLQALSIGGMIAPVEAWEVFDHEWAEALASERISAFHRREVGQWRSEKFLSIVGRRVPLVLGFRS